MRLNKLLLLLSDLLVLCLAFWLGQALRLHEIGGLASPHLQDWWLQEGQFRSKTFALAMLVGLLRFAISQSHYSVRRPFWDELREIGGTLCIMLLLDAAILFMTKWQFSRQAFLLTWMAAFVLLPVSRLALKHLLLRLGRWQRDVILVGNAGVAQEAWAALSSERLMGYRLARWFEVGPAGGPVAWAPIAPEPLPGDAAWTRALGSQLVVVALDDRQHELLASVIRDLSAARVDYYVIPGTRGLSMYGMDAFHVLTHDLLILHAENRLAGWPSRTLKRSFDLLGAALLLLLLSPVLLWLACRVAFEGGTVFFSHTRLGQGDRKIACHKFRTMVPEAEAMLNELLLSSPEARAQWSQEFKLRNDPRITATGHLLRRSSLDELPQLWNVLTGDMSLVGPRPIVPEELVRYGENASYYLQVRPGMTGLWQVSGRSDTDYDTRIALDVWYVRNWSLWYDLVILFKTVRVVLNRRGAY